MAKKITRIWMWREACAQADQAGALQRIFFRPSEKTSTRPVWEPPVDIFESASDIWIVAALPGVSADRVDIVIQETGIVIVAERRLPAMHQNHDIRCLEIPYGIFERRLALPMERFELTEKTLIDGCLTIRLRKIS